MSIQFEDLPKEEQERNKPYSQEQLSKIDHLIKERQRLEDRLFEQRVNKILEGHGLLILPTRSQSLRKSGQFQEEPETDWGIMVGEFSVAMLGRILQKEDDGWSGWQTITGNEYRLRAIKNIINGDYVEAANLCLLADAVRGTQEANDEKV